MNFRLIALDMDGTLLDGEGKIPPGFHELLSADAIFCPASGRQLGTLQAMFDLDTFIAENGAVLWHQGEVISTTSMPESEVHALIDAAEGAGCTPVVCTPTVAYIPTQLAPSTTAEINKYYRSTQALDDLHEAVSNQVVKVAVFMRNRADHFVRPIMENTSPEMAVVVSGAHWVDIMSPDANKGLALDTLREKLGIRRSEVVAFGDYLNDYALLQAAGTSYAMANAHPELKKIADHIAPPNTEHGVITVLKKLLLLNL